MQVELMKIESVKKIIQQAELEIFAQTNMKIRLLVASGKIEISFNYITQLIKEVCKVNLTQLCGKNKDRDIVDARRIVALILRDYSQLTYNEIAHLLKRDNHATIMNLITTARSFIKYRDDRFYPKVTAVLTILDSQIILNKIQ